MPGKIKVKVLAGRNLPVMDRAADTTDAFVEIKFGGVTHKTDVCRKSLNPHWNSTEWYRFEVDDSELQDEPLQLRLMDHDTYSANDAIGKVVVSLAPLLAREPLQTNQRPTHTGAIMSGWIPVFDTMHGIRGELNIIVKVELFSDFNKFRQSSCGVRFFHCPSVPPGYRATAIHGFVEELIVNDDPEYQWIDKIRTPRASNEARQVAFIKLSNQVQRRVGLKAAELGANAVVGYKQAFDLEGESGVVARAIGTAVSILALPTPCQPLTVSGYSQQQLRKHLEILAMDDENITDLNEYFQTHQDQLAKFMNILHPKLSSNYLDDQDGEDDKNSEITKQTTSIKSYAENLSIYQKDLASQQSLQNIAEDQIGLYKLLNPSNDSFEEPSSTFKKIKKFGQTSQGFFSKRLASIRRNRDKLSEDQISIKSNSSDNSRISITDIKKEFRKLKRIKKPSFRRTVSAVDDKGMGMASVLARSILHAHTSLACITETQDSGDSPSSTLRHRTSESEPTINISDDDNTKSGEGNDSKVSDDKENMNLVEKVSEMPINYSPFRIRKKSESCPTTPVSTQKVLLTLPTEVGCFGSISSVTSGDSSELFSSSEEDEESSDLKTDTEQSLETVSSVVKSVLENKNERLLIAQMEMKLNELSKASISTESSGGLAVDESTKKPSTNTVINDKVEVIPKKANTDPIEIVTKADEIPSPYFKFHNPFVHKTASKSISLPSSPTEKKAKFVSLSAVRIKRQLSRISQNSLIKSLSHLSLRPKKKESTTLIPSASSTNVKELSKRGETVLGSAFMSYTDLISLLNQQPKSMESPTSTDNKSFAMYIGSEPVSRGSLSGQSLSGLSSPAKTSIIKPDDIHNFNEQKHQKLRSHTEPSTPTVMTSSGLVHTAMQTILMDRIQNLMISTSSTPLTEVQSKEQKFFDDINEKLENIENSNRALSEEGSSHKKLVRQDSVHGSSTDLSRVDSRKMSDISHSISRSVPVLQHLHPMGVHVAKISLLETIPSLPESSFDRSVDEGVCSDPAVCKGVSDEALNASVCYNSHAACPTPCDRERSGESPRAVHARADSYGGHHNATAPANANGTPAVVNSSLNATSTPVGMQRRSSDSDLSITPKGSSLTVSGPGNTSATGGAILRASMNANNLEMLEYPFLTMTEYPPSFIVHIGGMVCARSVKLMDTAEGASRAAWWAELRTELRAHARALRCTAVLGYTESTTICEDVCILSASGTAAVIDLETDFTGDQELNVSVNPLHGSSAGDSEPIGTLDDEVEVTPNCALAHVPYSAAGMPYRAELSTCMSCGCARVPAVLLSTLERPRSLAATGRSCLVTAAAARARRAPPTAEPAARDLSDQLPFLEYELHRLLLAKLYIQGANALFGLRTQIAVGERAVVALATGTGALVSALPPPSAPKLKPSEGVDVRVTADLQKALHDALAANRARNGFEPQSPQHKETPPEVPDEPPSLELCGDKDACVLELDESEDVETARALAVQRPRHLVAATTARVCGVKIAPGARPHAFAQVWRARLNMSGGSCAAEKHVARALDGVHYKLRRLAPAALADLSLQLDLPEDEMQLLVSGVALPLIDPSKTESVSNGSRSCTVSNKDGAAGCNEDTIFMLDEEQTPPRQISEEKSLCPAVDLGAGCGFGGIAVTPLPRLAGARCQRWMCALQLLFVRETSSVRELGGLSGLLHTFITEVLAVVRAYTAALGGNALASFYITELMLQENPHKNQGQCLLSVGGDVVHVTY